MMLCKECHKKDEERYGCSWDGHLAKSRGLCEDCGQTATCADCKAYKKKDKQP